MAISETPNSAPAAEAEQQPFDPVPDAPVRRDREEGGADREHRGLDGDQPRER